MSTQQHYSDDIVTLAEMIYSKEVDINLPDKIVNKGLKVQVINLLNAHKDKNINDDKLNQELSKLMNEEITANKAERNTVEASYALGEESKFYQLLMNSDEKTIARIIDTLPVTTVEGGKKNESMAQFISKSSPPELLAKIQQISFLAAEREGRTLGGIQDAIEQLCNFLKKAMGTDVDSKKWNAAVDELLEKQKDQPALDEQSTKIAPTKGVQGFVDRVDARRAEKSENKVITK